MCCTCKLIQFNSFYFSIPSFRFQTNNHLSLCLSVVSICVTTFKIKHTNTTLTTPISLTLLSHFFFHFQKLRIFLHQCSHNSRRDMRLSFHLRLDSVHLLTYVTINSYSRVLLTYYFIFLFIYPRNIP